MVMRTVAARSSQCFVIAAIYKKRRNAVMSLLFSLCVGLLSLPLGAQQNAAPPFFVGKSEAVVIGIAYDESRVSGVAPAGIQVAAGGTGIIVMYTARDSYGLPPYSSAFLGLDVEGFDAPGGGKARWMLTGLYEPGEVTEALARYFHYPIRDGSTRVERNGHKVVAIGSRNGRELIRAELVLKQEPCHKGSGMVHEITRRAAGESLQLIKIPHAGEWCAAESMNVEIVAPEGDPFSLVGPVKALWGGFSVGGFGWSAPEIVR